MQSTRCTPGRAVSFALLFTLLLAGPVYAHDAIVVADFDGDGHGDQVTLTTEQPTVLHVWLSETKTIELVRSTEPLLHLVAADLDGDHRAELIASSHSWLLEIWTTRQKRFRTYRPKAMPRPVGFSGGRGRALAGRTASELFTTCTSRPLEASLAPTAHVAALISTEGRHAPRARNGALSPISFTLVAPRPPPIPTT